MTSSFEDNSQQVNTDTDEEDNQSSESETDDNKDGQLSDGYGDDEVTRPEDDKETNSGKIPEVVIPEFYNYIWLIVCGGILLIAGLVWAILFILLKKKRK